MTRTVELREFLMLISLNEFFALCMVPYQNIIKFFSIAFQFKFLRDLHQVDKSEFFYMDINCFRSNVDVRFEILLPTLKDRSNGFRQQKFGFYFV